MLFMEAVERVKREEMSTRRAIPLIDRTNMTEGDFADKLPRSGSTDHLGPFLSII